MDNRQQSGNSTPHRATTANTTKREKSAPLRGEIDAGMEHSTELAPDDRPNLKAEREAARQHSDAFIVSTDLEDADQREASPGTREQK